MSYTLFTAPGLKIWQDDLNNPSKSVLVPKLMQDLVQHPMLSYRHEKFSLALAETRSVVPSLAAAAEWQVIYALVVGKVSLATTGLDTDDQSAIAGISHCYGTSYLPGLLSIQTYNISAAVLTAVAASTIELLTGVIAASTDTRL